METITIADLLKKLKAAGRADIVRIETSSKLSKTHVFFKGDDNEYDLSVADGRAVCRAVDQNAWYPGNRWDFADVPAGELATAIENELGKSNV